MSYVRWAESVTDVASPEALFDFLDDQAALASHMGKPSMMMLGGRMSYALDDSAGRAVGSRIDTRKRTRTEAHSGGGDCRTPASGQQGLGDTGTAGPPCHRSLQDGIRGPWIRWWFPGYGYSSTTTIRQRWRAELTARSSGPSMHAGAPRGWPVTPPAGSGSDPREDASLSILAIKLSRTHLACSLTQALISSISFF